MARTATRPAAADSQTDTAQEQKESKRTRVKLPNATTAELDSYFGTGEEGEQNRNKAVIAYFDRARQAAAARAAKSAGVDFDQSFVDGEDFAKSYSDLRFGKRSSNGRSSTRKVKRSAAALNEAVNALGGVPKNEDELKALLAKLNVAVE